MAGGMLQANMHVQHSSEMLMQACGRLLSQADRQPSVPQRLRAPVQHSRPARDEQAVDSWLLARQQSGSQASTSQRGRAVRASTTDVPQAEEEPLGPRDDDVRFCPCA